MTNQDQKLNQQGDSQKKSEQQNQAPSEKHEQGGKASAQNQKHTLGPASGGAFYI